MSLVRIQSVEPVRGYIVKLTLSDGVICERDLGPLLVGLIFNDIRTDIARFREERVQDGTLVWPNGADLCPDVDIWGGAPPDALKSSAARDSAAV
jgi:hypothetical protein